MDDHRHSLRCNHAVDISNIDVARPGDVVIARRNAVARGCRAWLRWMILKGTDPRG